MLIHLKISDNLEEKFLRATLMLHKAVLSKALQYICQRTKHLYMNREKRIMFPRYQGNQQHPHLLFVRQLSTYKIYDNNFAILQCMKEKVEIKLFFFLLTFSFPIQLSRCRYAFHLKRLWSIFCSILYVVISFCFANYSIAKH